MKIKLTGHGMLNADPNEQVSWADVYVQYATSEGSTYYNNKNMAKGRWAPTLISRLDLVRNIDSETGLAKKNKNECYVTSFLLNAAKYREINRLLHYYDDIVDDDTTVYCKENYITRAIAERMITQFLDQNLATSERQRLAPYDFVWVKSEAYAHTT